MPGHTKNAIYYMSQVSELIETKPSTVEQGQEMQFAIMVLSLASIAESLLAMNEKGDTVISGINSAIRVTDIGRGNS